MSLDGGLPGRREGRMPARDIGLRTGGERRGPKVTPIERMKFGRPATKTLRNASTVTPAMPAWLMEGIMHPKFSPARYPIGRSMRAEP